MAKAKQQLPSSGGGLVRFSEEEKSIFQFKPGIVVIMVVIVILLVLFLHLQGNALFGLN